MFRQRFSMPKVDAGEEITFLGHGELAEDLIYVDIGHLGESCCCNASDQTHKDQWPLGRSEYTAKGSQKNKNRKSQERLRYIYPTCPRNYLVKLCRSGNEGSSAQAQVSRYLLTYLSI